MRWAKSGVAIEDMYGEWHHVAGTWGAKGMQFWFDGELKDTNTDYTIPPPDDLGTFFQVGSDPHSQTIKGYVDEVRISSKQLTADEMMLAPSAVSMEGKLPSTWGSLKSE